MPTLALLRDLAGCRAVLHDANEEARGPEVLGRLKAVLDEVVAALGGGEAQHIGWSSRRVTTWSTGGDPRWYEPDYHAWRAMRLREARAQLNRDWLAWDSNTRAARGRWWNPAHPAGPFDGIDRTVADGPGRADWLPDSPLAFGVGRTADPGVAYVNPRTYAQLQEQQRGRPAQDRQTRLRRRIRDRIEQFVPDAVATSYLEHAQAETDDLSRRCGAHPSQETMDVAVAALAVVSLLERDMRPDHVLRDARRHRDQALEAIRRSVNAADGTFEVSPPPTRTDPHAFELRDAFLYGLFGEGQSNGADGPFSPNGAGPGWHADLQAHLLASRRRHENPADVFGDGREWSRNLAAPARGYRPRWAPLLASELANLLPRREPPAPEAR